MALVGAMALFGTMTLVTVAGRASAHAPHDDITQVLASPAYRIDKTAFTISRSLLMRSTVGPG
jgi:hypothetical protein